MTRRLVLLALVANSATLFAADALPTVDQIFDRFVQVTGGKEMYAKQKTQYLTGRLEFPAQNIKGAIKRWAAEPDKYYSTLEIGGIGNIEMGVTNGIAWEKSAIMGPRIKSGAERAEALREATFNSSLNWKKLFPKATVEGLETIDGDECYKVVLQPAEGQPMTQYFSKKTGLAMRITTTASTQMGDVPVTITVADYKNFGGVWVAAKTTQKAAGQEFTMYVDTVESNVEIPADRFSMPADVAAIAAKAAK